jgi:crotonobetainyl-CoA:carnitine CoA-transferase CaiB-like acyl-CoA transferase
MGEDNTPARLRVLDLAQGIAGAYAAKLFADYSADVIKIEGPRGDPARRQSQPGQEPDALWLHLNTNKRGITLDIRQPRSRQLYELLIERAHLIIESFPPGYLDSLSLGFRHLTEIKRRIVLVSITPYGQRGPYANSSATDLTSLYLAEYVAGLHAFAAAAVAAFAADGSEVPQHVDISAIECLESTLATDLPDSAYYRQDVRQPAGAIRPSVISLPGPAHGRQPPAPPFRASALPFHADRAPLLGEHNKEIYCGELGLSPKELAELRAAEAV